MNDNAPKPTRFYQLPYAYWLPFIYGAGYGLVIRILYSLVEGVGQNVVNVMNFSFAIGAPLAIGAITVYIAERQGRKTFVFYIFAPMLSVTLFVLGTALLLIEGSICIAMAMPLFLGLSSVGGLVMGLICRYYAKPVRTIQSIALLPLVMAIVNGPAPLPNHIQTITRSVHIAASPATVWQHILAPSEIKPAEFSDGLVYRIGVPYPVSAQMDGQGTGSTRHSNWQRGVSFDEIITAWEPKRRIAWQYQFNTESFPPGSMDDHVKIGGKYFDLVDTAYTLIPSDHATRLKITIRYRVSTGFNWYAVPVAKYLISDTATALLKFYKHRSESIALNN